MKSTLELVLLMLAAPALLGLWFALIFLDSRRPLPTEHLAQLQKCLQAAARASGFTVFDPAKAMLLREKSLVSRSRDGSITSNSHRIYRSAEGNYFLFVWSSNEGDKGYLTHLSPDRARNALRSDKTLFKQEFPDAS